MASAKLRKLALRVATGAALVLGLGAAVPVAHDVVVVHAEDNADEASWHVFATLHDSHLPQGWREALLEGDGEAQRRRRIELGCTPRDVRALGGSEYSVPTLVERMEPDGSWTRVALDVRIRREGYGAWRITGYRFPGEPEQPLDLFDWYGSPGGLWTPAILERLGVGE